MAEVSMNEIYDIAIIGAGPAGSSAARAAAQRGAKVLMIDQKQRIGAPVQCAEFVPQWISRHASFTSSSILQSIDTMVTHLPDGTCYRMKGPGYMVDRSLFDKELVASAILAGARLSTETKAIRLSSSLLSPSRGEGRGRGDVNFFNAFELVVQRGTKQETIKSKVIIGADGVHSSIARWVGLRAMKSIVAIQYEVANPHSQNHIDIFFHINYKGGYAWFFPKGKTANVGVGVIPQKTSNLPNLMNHFLNHLIESKKLPGIDIVGKTGGSIPCEKPRQTVFANILLVGDAAGHAHPITGAGILNAVIGGEIAGRVAAEAIVRGDTKYLENYEIEWREAFGKFLSYGALKREFLEENWNKAGVDFEGLIRKTWIGFKEYYGDRKRNNETP